MGKSNLDMVTEILSGILKEETVDGMRTKLQIFYPGLRKMAGDYDGTLDLENRLEHENEGLRRQLRDLKRAIHVLSEGQNI